MKYTKTKRIFRFGKQDEKEPSTNQTYDSLLKRLTFIKSFATGILVSKNYIWPVEQNYLARSTSIVQDANVNGLQLFVEGFANDNLPPYNNSYNLVDEYLTYIDNGVFSVDGLLSDFPMTLSAARDLKFSTTVIPNYHHKMSIIKEIQDKAGIFSFSLDWSEIQSLTPKIIEPFEEAGMLRNPEASNSGRIISLHEFLELGKNSSSVFGVLIKIENARFLLTNRSTSIVNLVTESLGHADYDTPESKRVFIQSSSSAVLKKFKYDMRLFEISKSISSVEGVIPEIKGFADAVVLNKASV
ncbi:hypothetical protein KSS87_010393 [Heliosperma pusillum]|nr:hypothetical protein KSS87_010393 [Heliosperma pusillum]